MIGNLGFERIRKEEKYKAVKPNKEEIHAIYCESVKHVNCRHEIHGIKARFTTTQYTNDGFTFKRKVCAYCGKTIEISIHKRGIPKPKKPKRGF